MGILEFGMVWFLLNLLHPWNLFDADKRALHVEHCMCMLIVDIHGIYWILTEGHCMSEHCMSTLIMAAESFLEYSAAKPGDKCCPVPCGARLEVLGR